jgi:broad specificity phosphatase PhoE
VSDNSDTRTRLVLIRHGESVSTVTRRIGGWRTCSGLSDLGREQAKRLAERLAAGELDADALYTSHYPRARETAEAVAPVLGLDPIEDPGFGEHDPGAEVDGMTFTEFVERYGHPEWHGDPHAEVFPGGETIATFHHRVGAAAARALDEHRGGTIVVSCHGGVVDAVFRLLLRLPQTGGFELFTVNTSLTEFASADQGKWVLARYNDAAHLAGLPPSTPRDDDPQ